MDGQQSLLGISLIGKCVAWVLRVALIRHLPRSLWVQSEPVPVKNYFRNRNGLTHLSPFVLAFC
jgi:hypothetical protein